MIVHNWKSIQAKNNISKWLAMEKYFIDNLSKTEKNEIMKTMRLEFNNYVDGQKEASTSLLSSSAKSYMTSKIKADADLIIK